MHIVDIVHIVCVYTLHQSNHLLKAFEEVVHQDGLHHQEHVQAQPKEQPAQPHGGQALPYEAQGGHT